MTYCDYSSKKKKKIDDLTNKFKLILDENNQLHAKLEKLPMSMRGDSFNDTNNMLVFNNYDIINFF